MRYPPGHKERTRERIIRAAARRFRSRGSEGAAIGDLMRDLRLTHGGFYRHFGSKEELFVEAFRRSLQDVARRMSSAAEHAPRGAELKAIIDAYLDLGHCDKPADGCPFAALAPELTRRPLRARAALLRVVRSFVAELARYVPGATDDERQRKARMLFSGMAGTLTVARIMPDREQRRRILDDAKEFYRDAMRR
jgi:TetR/AcrR family transcriptional regulator, transcriptional repressor for nem operon